MPSYLLPIMAIPSDENIGIHVELKHGECRESTEEPHEGDLDFALDLG